MNKDVSARAVNIYVFVTMVIGFCCEVYVVAKLINLLFRWLGI